VGGPLLLSARPAFSSIWETVRSIKGINVQSMQKASKAIARSDIVARPRGGFRYFEVIFRAIGRRAFMALGGEAVFERGSCERGVKTVFVRVLTALSMKPTPWFLSP
jgi:hypothetical protein